MKSGFLTLLSLPLLFVGSTAIQSNICESPTTPVIAAPTANSTLSSRITVMSGTATASSTVTVTDNNQPAANVTSDVNGDFAVQLTLAVGQNQLTAQTSNPCGTSGTASETVTVKLPVVKPPVSPPVSGSGSIPSGSTGGVTTGSVSGGNGQTTGGSKPISPATVTPSPAGVVSIVITTPADHLTTSKTSIFVAGTTSVSSTEMVSVNGTKVATLYSTTDFFGVSVPLKLGDNTIQVTITANGKTATAHVNITRIRYQPLVVPWYDTTWGRIFIIATGLLLVLLSSILILVRKRRNQQAQRL